MGLYDSYKLNNSSYIPQFVGSVVPELQGFSQTVQKRYNEAVDTDDALTEALGNLQHLGLEADTQYANELKQNYLTKLMDRSQRSDYENMGRRTKRDAQRFSAEYTPLLQRQRDLSTELGRVNADEKIFDPNKKAEIAARISYMNDSRRNSSGEFDRDENGRIRLGAIQTWAYAKDVDINKKLADFLKIKETEETQSAYRANGAGLMISNKREFRNPADIARMAKEMMDTDPEIRAMVERDVELATYRLSPSKITDLANKDNVSIYDRLKRAGLSEQMINSNLQANGVSKETARLKPLDVLRADYISKGLPPEKANEDYVKNQVRKQITSPHAELVANLLKVDKRTIEAREDPIYAAKMIAAAVAAAIPPTDSGTVSPLLVTPDNAESAIDVVRMNNNVVEATQAAESTKSSLQAAVGSYLGLPKPNGANTADWYNKTNRYLNDKNAQGDLLSKLKGEGKLQEANNLTVAFNNYNNLNNKIIYAKQQMDNFTKEVDFAPLYSEYVKLEKGKKLSLEQFKKELTAPTKVEQRSFMGSTAFSRSDETMWDRMTNKEAYALRVTRDKYFNKLQETAGKTGQTANTVFEPTSSGWAKNQTEFVENGLRTGDVKAVDMATGEDLSDIIRKELGSSGWFRFGNNDKQVSATDKSDPNSDYNKAMRQFKARINVGTRGSNGEPTATITTPGGSKRTVVLQNISPNLPTELAARMLVTSGKNMTRGEAAYHGQSAAEGAGWAALRNTNQAELYNVRPSAKPYQLNDLYYLKVSEAGVKGGQKQNYYTLMVKDGDKFVPTRVANRTNLTDIIQQIGGQILQQQMSTIPSVGPVER